MRWAVLVSAVVWSCAPSSSSNESAPTRSLRQPLPILGPPETGAPGSLLGSTLVSCPGGGYVAGAPGTGTAWHSFSGVTPQPVGEGLGRAVACVPGGTGNSEMLAGGDAGIRKAVAGSWSPAAGAGSVMSMSVSDVPSLPLLIGYSGAVVLASPSTATQVGTAVTGGVNGFGAVVKWFPGETRFAVTHGVGAVQLYDYDQNGQSITPGITITNGATGFGRALAVGDVLPSPGQELIVGSSGGVYVYLHDGQGPMLHLTGNNSSFGAAVITAATGYGIDEMIIGEPSDDTTFSFLGDAGEVFATSSSPGERFGASLASNGAEFAVGAPDHLMGSGAVYTFFSFSQLAGGEVQECMVGRPCVTSGCQQGECLGGVFCDTAAGAQFCLANETCVQGACFGPDGGVVRGDAGVIVRDAGVIDPDPDAGLPDASVVLPDASVVLPDASVMLPDASVSSDAGTIGPGDAGTSVDAGVDAGTAPDGGPDTTNRDAGSTDRDAGVKPPKDAGLAEDGGVDGGAEPMIFTTSGCSESAALPLLAICLVWLRRRN